MDNTRVLTAIYLAISSALSEEGVRLANDILFDLADSPTICSEDARIIRSIAETASCELPAKDTPDRPRLKVITGGVA